jgi:hypothetical protein
MKNAVFWHVTPCGSSMKRRFGGTYRLHKGEINRQTRNVSSNYQLDFSETSVLTKFKRRRIAKTGTLQPSFHFF